MLDLWLMNLEDNKLVLIEGIKFVVICCIENWYNSLKPIQ